MQGQDMIREGFREGSREGSRERSREGHVKDRKQASRCSPGIPLAPICELRIIWGGRML